ncbi:MAG TPA: biotin/lipoyl-containing protein [Candidatus Limnocylindria bacterium]
MSERDDELAEVQRAADEVIPGLVERLRRHGVGELEVRIGTLRVRVVAGQDLAASAVAQPSAAATPAPAGHATPVGAHLPAGDRAGDGTQGVTSPAVGFFVYADGLGPGLAVQKGDPLGHVEMLGVRHDVRAPRGGMVRNLVTEAGEPVEYGQVLIEMEPAE